VDAKIGWASQCLAASRKVVRNHRKRGDCLYLLQDVCGYGQ